jgi:hypothetical protein
MASLRRAGHRGLAEKEGTMTTTKPTAGQVENATEKAERLVADLDRNGDDYHFHRIDHATFSARNEKIWRDAETDGRVAELVSELLLNR